MLVASAFTLILGYFMDRLFGDPVWLWHPVQGIGWLITRWEKLLRTLFPKTPAGERAAGFLLVPLVIFSSLILPGAVLYLSYHTHIFAGFLVESIFCYQILAAKSLRDESGRVADALAVSLPAAREAVGRIVGRDTQKLSEEGVIRAAVETVAENTSDGVIAPMMYMAVGGALFGFFYKAVNTMDSMVGYRNDRYLWFGRAAARFDDFCNFLPARLTALLMTAGAALLGMDAAGAVRVYRTDHRKHASPNAACGESVMAGALGVQLAGDAWYFGKLYRKETIGENRRSIETQDIRRAGRLMYVTETLALILFSGLKWALICRLR